MKKKTTKKIGLSKETLRVLQLEHFRQAEGGAQQTMSCYTLCGCNSEECTWSCMCESQSCVC